MLGISFDEGFDESGFAHTWRTNDCNDNGRRFGWEAVDERDMKALLFDLGYRSESADHSKGMDKVHHGSELPVFVIYQGWRMQMLWGSCLQRVSAWSSKCWMEASNRQYASS